jgi:hypothetical protein
MSLRLTSRHVMRELNFFSFLIHCSVAELRTAATAQKLIFFHAKIFSHNAHKLSSLLWFFPTLLLWCLVACLGHKLNLCIVSTAAFLFYMRTMMMLWYSTCVKGEDTEMGWKIPGFKFEKDPGINYWSNFKIIQLDFTTWTFL